MSKKMEEKEVSFELDDTTVLDEVHTTIHSNEVEETPVKPRTKKVETMENPPVNILRNEKVIVRHIPRETAMVTNPKHILYGGMAENAVRIFVVPRLRTGSFVNVLTDNEKAFLEEAMGLEYNDLSVFKKKNNFWDDSNEFGISKVRLTKADNYLDLSQPEDYIKYKILLANKDFIAPSLQYLQDHPKATYQFVIIAEGEETKQAKDNMSTTMKCYKEYGKIENDIDTLRVIIETIDGRPTSANSKLEFLQTKINNLIQADSKLFLNVITDPLLPTKVLLKKCTEAGIVSNRDGHFYLRSDNSPLCEANEESSLNVAARYLNSPRHQDILFALQAKLKQ